MSDTPLAERRLHNNESALLTNTYAYSPHPPPLSKQSLQNQPEPSQADSIQKILSTSIQRAKQKITMLQGRQRDQRGESRQDRAGSKQAQSGTNAVASAMRVLQSRVGELECSVDNLQRERTIILKELDNLTSEKQIILTNLEESNGKLNLLEQANRNYKAEIKELTRKVQEGQTTQGEWEARCQGLEMSIRHLQKDKQQISAQLARREQEIAARPPPTQKLSHSKSPQSEERERQLLQRERKLHERERRLMQFESGLKQKQSRLVHQKLGMVQVQKQNELLHQQVASLQQSLSLSHQQQNDERQRLQGDLLRMENELNMLRETAQQLAPLTDRSQEIDLSKQEEFTSLRAKHEEVLHLYRRNQDKLKREEKETRSQRDRVRELQDLLTELIQKVGKLPSCTKDLKYLTVKAGKVISNNIEKLTTLKTPTKSRSNSLNRSLSRSNSQRKNTQNSQLTNSRQSSKGNSGIKPGKNTSGSKGKKGEESAGKAKRVVVSQSGFESVEREVAELKKEYKRLVKILNETENEEVRNRLNELAFAIQQKGERATRTKQQNRMK